MSELAMASFQDTITRFIGWPLLWLLLALGAITGVMSQCGCSPVLTLCSPTDLEGELYLHNCETLIRAQCDADGAGGEPPVRDTTCKPLQECLQWGEQRCSEAP
jgi:hypothetical protein